jgi:hypothetical protein
VLKDGARTVVDATRTGVDTWLGDRLRPKWGIYRSVLDPAHLHDTFLLIKNLRAFQVS